MPFLLRKIIRSKWYRTPPHSWLGENEIEADALNDLRTQADTLSVWLIDDAKTNLERIIVAMVANGNHLDYFDYVLLPFEIIKEMDIKILQNAGDTPDEEANRLWHQDLVELTVSKIVSLANAFRFRGEVGRRSVKEILSLITQEKAAQHLDRNKIKIETSKFWDVFDQL